VKYTYYENCTDPWVGKIYRSDENGEWDELVEARGNDSLVWVRTVNIEKTGISRLEVIEETEVFLELI